MAKQRETTPSSITTPVTNGRESTSCDVPPSHTLLCPEYGGRTRYQAPQRWGSCRNRTTVSALRSLLRVCMSSGATFQVALVPSTLKLRLRSLGYLVTFPKLPGHLHGSLDEGCDCTSEHQDILRLALPGLPRLGGKEGPGTFFRAPGLGAVGSCRGGSGRWKGVRSPEIVIGSTERQFLRN